MLLANKDVIKWLGFSSFEIFIQLSCLLVCTILIMCKVELESFADISWWRIFIPMFAADGMTLYFSTIVFIRTFHKGNHKEAFRRVLWVSLLLVLLFLFKMLLCQLLEGAKKTSAAGVMSPLFVLWGLLIIRACKVT
ncbi:transmembrane protein 203-like [Styela clava]|uniref:transmembrane protein 203-like n=1 Tax=Styela clava TaxID=7725 RepID=UPI00193ABE2C|nr:transmembrane protein 203-like [Styela clava]XP_039256668.1 transmembrane protein 203-like [Styela clava]